MADKEDVRWQVEVSRWKIWMFLMLMSEFSDKRGVIWRGNRTPLIELVEYAQWLKVNQFQHSHVIRERNVDEFMKKPLFFEQIFFLFEYL